MWEHEAKILNVNETELRHMLEALGAKKILDDITYIEGFDFDANLSVKAADIPSRFRQIFSLIQGLRGSADMFSQGAYLRLRREGERNELIFKQRAKGSDQVKSEIEISEPIAGHEWAHIAGSLREYGLKRIVVQEKKRISYVLPPYRYDIDTWPGVPTYLEVEAPTPEQVLEAVEMLGFARERAVSMSAAEVFNMYGIRNPRYLVFDKERKR